MEAEKTEVRVLTVELTDDEIKDTAIEMASLAKRITTEKSAQVYTKKIMKSKLAELTTTYDQAFDRLARGSEDREIECSVVFDGDEGVVRIYRSDTDELVEKRPMHDKEYQKEFQPQLDMSEDTETEEGTEDPNVDDEQDGPESVDSGQAEDEGVGDGDPNEEAGEVHGEVLPEETVSD